MFGSLFSWSLSCQQAMAACVQESETGRMFSGALSAAQHDVPEKDALDRAGERLGFGATQVNEVRMVLRMTPIFLLTILYWTVYSQMASVFVIQAKYMDRRIPIGDATYKCARFIVAYLVT